MSPIEKIKKWPTYVKAGIGIAATLLSLVGGVWAIDDRYVDQVEIVSSLKSLDNAIQLRMDNLERTQDLKELQAVTDEYYKIKRMMKMYPDDQELKEDFERVKSRRISLQIKLGVL